MTYIRSASIFRLDVPPVERNSSVGEVTDPLVTPIAPSTLAKTSTFVFHQLQENRDPFAHLQSQERFETELTQVIQELSEWRGDPKTKKRLAERLAKLSLVQSLCSYSIDSQLVVKLDSLLSSNTLPDALRFPLRQLMGAKATLTEDLLTQQAHYQDRMAMRAMSSSGLTEEKGESIIASRRIEGYDSGPHGIRMAVHQRPGLRTAALIVSHENEYLSGRKRFVFMPPQPYRVKAIVEEMLVPVRKKITVLESEYNRICKEFTVALNVLEYDDTIGRTPFNYYKAFEKAIVDLQYSRFKNEIKEICKSQLKMMRDRLWSEHQSARREVMSYLVDALETDRKAYYARRPDYLDSELLGLVVNAYNEGKCLNASAYHRSMQEKFAHFPSDQRYLFEAAAQKLVSMKQRILDRETPLEDFEVLAKEFYMHYRVVYTHLPTTSLTVAATIYPDVVSETAHCWPQLTQIGVVPETLKKMIAFRKHNLPASVLRDFEPLIQSFVEGHEESLIVLRRLIDQLNRAVNQSEFYMETTGAEIPKEKIDFVDQPKQVFVAVQALRSFIQEHLHSSPRDLDSTQKTLHTEAETCLSYLERLEEAAALRLLEGVREKTIEPEVALSLVERAARANGAIGEKPLEESLQEISNESLMGYQKLRHALYNSEMAHRWISDAETDIDTLCQTYVSNLNSGFIGALSQLSAFATCGDERHIGGQALVEGTFYGTLVIAPERIEGGQICVLATMPHQLSELRNAVGIIVEEGGPLSHAANIARELKIPAIIGAKEAVKHLQTLHGERVRLLAHGRESMLERFEGEFPLSKPVVQQATPKLDAHLAGGKGSHLIQLEEACQMLPKISGVSISVPSYEILDRKFITAFYDTSMDGRTLRQAILEVPDSPDQIRALIMAHPLPSSLNEYAKTLNISPKNPLIARSSASVEDGASSFSGLFTSIPDIGTVDDLEKGIKEVLLSAFSPEIIEYTKTRGITSYDPFDMAVILQQYVADATLSGVGFSQDPQGKDTFVRLQLVRGTGGGVDAKGYPDEAIIDIQRKGIMEAHSGKIRGRPLLSPDHLKKVGLIVKQLEQIFDYPIDVEFVIKILPDRGLELSFVQCRPIT